MAQRTTRAGILRQPQTEIRPQDRQTLAKRLHGWQDVILRPELAQVRRQEVLWRESLDGQV